MKIKKLLATTMLGATIVTCSYCNTVSAQDVWFGSSGKTNFYVRTESIHKNGYDITCDTISTTPDGKYFVYHEKFKYAVRMWNYYANKNTLRPVSSNAYYSKMFDVVKKQLHI